MESTRRDIRTTRSDDIKLKSPSYYDPVSSASSDDEDSSFSFFSEEDSVTDEGGRSTRNTGFKVSFSNLPGSMTEDDFLTYFGDLPPHNYFFYKPPVRCGNMPPFCAAIVNFLHKEDVADWIQRLSGIVLVDPREEEFVVEVDIMYNQDLPKRPIVEKDPLEGTIEETEEFQTFQDHYEDTDGVFTEPPIPVDILQETMLREIDEKKAKNNELQDTPLVKFLNKKGAAEREKSRVREETAAAALRKAKEKRREREERDKESKERRRERQAKEKLRKEAARRARRAAKQEAKKQSLATEKPDGAAPDKGDASAVPAADSKVADDGPPVPRTPLWVSRPASQEASEKGKKEDPAASASGGGNSGRFKEKDQRRGGGGGDGRYGGRSYRNSNKGPQWERGEGNWRPPKAKVDKGPSDSAKGDANSKTVDPTVPKSETKADSAAVPSTSTAAASATEDKKEPKKKIIKKIVRVRKVKGTGDVVAVTESESTTVPSTAKKSDTAAEKPSTSNPNSSSAAASSSDGAKSTQNRDKARRGRPDREVYRPGAWRRNSAAGQGTAQKQNSENTKPSSTES